ncbi:MAG: metallophosphoesterase [Bacteroidales bacterium]|jgi:hypothetical protein
MYTIRVIAVFLFVFLTVRCQQHTIIEGKGDLYILQQEEGGYRVVAAGVNGELIDTLLEKVPDNLLFRYHAAHDKTDVTFDFTLHRESRRWDIFAKKNLQESLLPEKTLVVSDLHGRLDAFSALLTSNGVTDDDYRWTFGTNRLVFIGDIVDRGRDDNGIAWLLYKLQEEAKKAGGEVVFLQGNHEDLVLKNDLRYVHKEHLAFADTIGIPYADLYGKHTVLGAWIRNSPLIFVAGDFLFVHAGLSTVMVDQEYGIEEINRLIQEYIGYPNKERNEFHPRNEVLFGRDGPLWYRGLVFESEKYPPINSDDLEKVLQYYGIKHMVVGHSEVTEVEKRYNGCVYAVNVKHARNYKSNRTGGLMIDGDTLYAVTYSGEKQYFEALPE